MGNSIQKSAELDPDWRKRICDERGRIRDEQTRRDYETARLETRNALLENRRGAYHEEVEKEAEEKGEAFSDREMERKIEKRANEESRQCVDSMDWEKHQAARSNPDPNAPGRIGVERDFSRDPALAEVSRSEKNSSVAEGGYTTLNPKGNNFVGLGEKDRDLNSDQTQDHFALPRHKENEDKELGPAERSNYRISYKFDKDAAGKGRQFALRDDCSGGTWTVKYEDGRTSQFHREGGGQQAVIIQGGEHFKAQTEKDQILAHNRQTGQSEKIGINPRDPQYGKTQEQASAGSTADVAAEPKAATKAEPRVEPASKSQTEAGPKAEPQAENRANPAASPEKDERRREREAKYAQQGKDIGAESGKGDKTHGDKDNPSSGKDGLGKE